MGVQGLWTLLEPAGKPIPLEALEGKTLAIDVSIWLNQAVKGFRDSRTGGAVPNAHLLGLFHRICKLLFYRIRPIFVFDGRAPQLKRDTLNRRRLRRVDAAGRSRAATVKIIDNFLKKQAVASQLQRQTLAMDKVLHKGQEGLVHLLQDRAKAKDGGEKDLYELPPIPEGSSSLLFRGSSSSSSEDEGSHYGRKAMKAGALSMLDTSDIHSLDVESKHFRALPMELQLEVLAEVKEKRKQNSWHKISEMPEDLGSFSGYQMGRLLKRRKVQKKLKSVERAIGEEATRSLESVLFVGDREGLKKAKKKEISSVASSKDGAISFLFSGLRSDLDDDEKPLLEADQKMGSSSSKIKENRTPLFHENLRDLSEDDDEGAVADAKTLDGLSAIVAKRLAASEGCQSSEDDENLSQSDLMKLFSKHGSDGDLKKVEKREISMVASSKDGDVSFLFSGLKSDQDEDKKLQDADQRMGRSSSKTKNYRTPIVHDKLLDPGEDNDNDNDDDDVSSSGKVLDSVSALVAKRMAATRGCQDGEVDEIFSQSDHMKPASKHDGCDDQGLLDDSPVLQPSSQLPLMSNRRGGGRGGGQGFPQLELAKKLEEEGPCPEQDPGDEDEVGIISSSCSSDDEADLKTEDKDDLFGDVFSEGGYDPGVLEDILKKHTESRKVASAFGAFEKNPAGVGEKVMRPPEDQQQQEHQQEQQHQQDHQQQISCRSNSSIKIGVKDNHELAEAMKKSDHLWLKLASKWAVVEKTKDPKPLNGSSGSVAKDLRGVPRDESHVQNGSKPGGPTSVGSIDLVGETERLKAEMQMKVREDRLLAIKGQTAAVAASDDVKRRSLQAAAAASSPDPSTADVLKRLGAGSMGESEFEAKVILDEGLPEDPDDSGAYGAAADGFVRSHRRSDVVEVGDLPTSTGSVDDQAAAALEIGIAPSDAAAALTEEELLNIQEELAKEQEVLVADRAREERLAGTLTDQMYSDCQELLQLFGIPWVVSPSEAEAQCAFLDEAGLAHGTITDDSDIWVFGGKTVYKNFFERQKYCEAFYVSEISKHFGLTREKMILLAMLTGSDYTEGIENVGPVTAMEILSEFQGSGLEPLIRFKEWMDTTAAGDKGLPGSKTREHFRRLTLPPNFPNERVLAAYNEPLIDLSREKFSWAVPNFVAVRDYAGEKFGWSKQKTDELLKPVIQKLGNKRLLLQVQDRIDNYFQSERLQLPSKGHLQNSRRVQDAIQKVLKRPASGVPCDHEEKHDDQVGQGQRHVTKKPKISAIEGIDAPAASSSSSCKPIRDCVKNSEPILAPGPSTAKERAVEILRRSKEGSSGNKSNLAPKTRNGRYRRPPARKVLDSHRLSESDSD